MAESMLKCESLRLKVYGVRLIGDILKRVILITLITVNESVAQPVYCVQIISSVGLMSPVHSSHGLVGKLERPSVSDDMATGEHFLTSSSLLMNTHPFRSAFIGCDFSVLISLQVDQSVATAETGDLIEFVHPWSGLSLWGVYFGEGFVMHFGVGGETLLK